MRLRERPTRKRLPANILLPPTNTSSSTAKNTTTTTSNVGESSKNSKHRNRSIIIIQRWILPLLAGLFVVLILLGRRWRTTSSIPGVLVRPGTTTSNETDTVINHWCDRVTNARTDLNPDLVIHSSCETILNSQYSAAAAAVVSVVVYMLTGSFDPHRANTMLFTAREYLDGALALGVTVQKTKTSIRPALTYAIAAQGRV